MNPSPCTKASQLCLFVIVSNFSKGRRILSETHKRSSVVAPNGDRGMACEDLLSDEIVSEQLTRYHVLEFLCQ